MLPALLMSVALHALAIGLPSLEQRAQRDGQILGIVRPESLASGGRSLSTPLALPLIVEIDSLSLPPADPLSPSPAAQPPTPSVIPSPLSAAPTRIGSPRTSAALTSRRSNPTDSPSRPAKRLSLKAAGHQSKTDPPALDRRSSAVRPGPKGGGEIARPQPQAPTQPTDQTAALAYRPQELQAVEGEYLKALLAAIARAQRYPERARRQGKSGAAVVSFVIQADGSLSAIRLARGSGHPELDQAALESLNRLGRFKPIPPGLNRSHWPIQVPIRFRLER